ncbi:Deleted in malignant brain tumors 1 protein, partial [Pygoscelis adeliae]
VRLVDGPHRCAGRVEIFHNQQWGTVCDNGWDLSDAAVVCWQLGCGVALAAPAGASFGRGLDPIWLDRVTCVGGEKALVQCRARPWGINSCTHEEDAGVVCSESLPWTRGPLVLNAASPASLPADLARAEVAEVRLVEGPNRCAGRVEVLHTGQWGTICDDSWDLNDAAVVCRQLGCGRAEAAHSRAYFGQGTGHIWLDDMSCTGSEDNLAQCQAHPWGQSNCHHGEDAGVVCSGTSQSSQAGGRPCLAGGAELPGDRVIAPGVPAERDRARAVQAGLGSWRGTEVPEPGPIRLVGGPNRCAGRVEVLHEEQWGSVCHDNWDLNDAQVVCKQLGCGDAVLAPIGAKFGRGFDTIWLDDVNCTGVEAALSECPARPWGDHNCYHGEDASAVCSGCSLNIYFLGIGTEVDIPEEGPVRLVDGPNKCAGRVEVLHENRWGSVCDDHWDMKDAKVVCKQVGCGSPLSALGGARYGRGPDMIWLDDVKCNGTEESIFDCQARPWGEHNCYHGEDADVVC